MFKVTGIRFRKAGKIYYFDPSNIEINAGEHVIVETVRGIEYGTVVLASKEVEEKEVIQPLKKVLRLATEEDKQAEVKNKEKEQDAFLICKEKINKHGLVMKLIDCEYTFDHKKLLFYFTSDGRVDFRELVKDLASVFKTRIELRQVGVRDETKMIGSIGICGRTLCCHAHLSDFHPVSIKMAKNQNLSLNPTKISGVCGRLMCCLKYEEDTYKELNKNLPKVGDKIKINESGIIADVINTNIIRQLVKVIYRKEDGTPEIVQLKLSEIERKQNGKFKERQVTFVKIKETNSEDKAVRNQPTNNNNRHKKKQREDKQHKGKPSSHNRRPTNRQNKPKPKPKPKQSNVKKRD